jgi:putative ABC transport system permease protein
VLQKLAPERVQQAELIEPPKPPQTPAPGPSADGGDLVIKVKGIDDLLVYRAKCCNPIRGEAIVGYVTRGKGIAVHSKLCPNVQNLIVRLSAGDVGAGVAAIDAAWSRLGARVPIQRRFMDEAFNQSFEKFARYNQVFVALMAVAFFISIIGLFGMAVQVAGRRMHEIGVRKSVGARKSQMVIMLLRDFSKPVLAANLIAWPLAYLAAQQYLRVFIQRISLTPLPFVASLAIVLAIAWAAVGSQAWRAARANPATVLRFE